MDTQLLGRYGEERTADYLRRRGYKILALNYRTRFGEVDVIASRGGYIAFVEVKLRKNAVFAQAREFVTAQKQRRVILAAESYLQSCPTELQPRFDVAEVYAPEGFATRRPRIRYWENAFTLD